MRWGMMGWGMKTAEMGTFFFFNKMAWGVGNICFSTKPHIMLIKHKKAESVAKTLSESI